MISLAENYGTPDWRTTIIPNWEAFALRAPKLTRLQKWKRLNQLVYQVLQYMEKEARGASTEVAYEFGNQLRYSIPELGIHNLDYLRYEGYWEEDMQTSMFLIEDEINEKTGLKETAQVLEDPDFEHFYTEEGFLHQIIGYKLLCLGEQLENFQKNQVQWTWEPDPQVTKDLEDQEEQSAYTVEGVISEVDPWRFKLRVVTETGDYAVGPTNLYSSMEAALNGDDPEGPEEFPD